MDDGRGNLMTPDTFGTEEQLLAAGLGDGGKKFSTEDLEIIDLNRHSRGRGLILPDLRRTRAGR